MRYFHLEILFESCFCYYENLFLSFFIYENDLVICRVNALFTVQI